MSYLLELLPLAIGAALIPVWIIIVLVLLTAEGGLAKAAAFVTGATLARLLQGFLFGFVLAADGDPDDGAGIIISTLLLVLGILLLVTAYKKWAKEEDSDAPPPAWMARVQQMAPAVAFGTGLAAMFLGAKGWVFTLSAVGVTTTANRSPAVAVVLFLFYVLLAQSLMIAPVLAAALAPQRSAASLAALRAWLERNNRPIAIAVSLVFGVFFLWKGIAGLIG